MRRGRAEEREKFGAGESSDTFLHSYPLGAPSCYAYLCEFWQVTEHMNGRFEVGNRMGKGRPAGSRNKVTTLREALEDGGVEIILKIKSQALKGDPTAMRLCMERLLPVAKRPNSCFRLPPIERA